MPPASPTDPAALSRRRRRVWGGVLLLAAVAGAAWWLRPSTQRPVAPEPATLTVRVLDSTGEPARSAQAFLLQRSSDAPGGAWDPASATFTVPAHQAPARVLVGAPGHRMGEVTDVDGNLEVTLRPGVQVRILLEGRELLEGEGHLVMLRLRPVPGLDGLLPGAGAVDRGTLVSWIQPLLAPPEVFKTLTREEFGVALTAEQAEHGVRLPAPGRYSVHWGVLAAEQGTWFTLEDRTGKVLGVQDRSEPTSYALRITPEGAEQTLKGLKEWIARVQAR